MTGAQIKGQCLCGKVTAQAILSKAEMNVCHCEMCRQHTSSMFMSLGVDEGSLSFDGPVKVYRSSEWAERGFCEICGSTLFYGMADGTGRYPSAGLFKDAAGAELKLEFFADEAPGYALAGTHRKMTAKETIALFAPETGEV